MVEKLIGAIGDAFRNKWGDEYAVYTEAVEQGVKKPCFFIECEKSDAVRLLGERFFVRCTVKVTLDSDKEDKKCESGSLTGDMFKLLGLIEADGGFFRGRKISGTWESGGFAVRAVYDVYPVWEEEAELMEKIEAKEVLNERE